jgi:hypothetical protein
MASVMAVRTQNTVRHGANPRMMPPRVGARTGEMPLTIIMKFMYLVVWCPSVRSVTADLARTTPAAPEKPMRNRRVMSRCTVGATAHPAVARTQTSEQTTRGRRRPHWSERGPTTICPIASPAMKAERVSWTCDAVVPRS